MIKRNGQLKTGQQCNVPIGSCGIITTFHSDSKHLRLNFLPSQQSQDRCSIKTLSFTKKTTGSLPIQLLPSTDNLSTYKCRVFITENCAKTPSTKRQTRLQTIIKGYVFSLGFHKASEAETEPSMQRLTPLGSLFIRNPTLFKHRQKGECILLNSTTQIQLLILCGFH